MTSKKTGDGMEMLLESHGASPGSAQGGCCGNPVQHLRCVRSVRTQIKVEASITYKIKIKS